MRDALAKHADSPAAPHHTLNYRKKDMAAIASIPLGQKLATSGLQIGTHRNPFSGIHDQRSSIHTSPTDPPTHTPRVMRWKLTKNTRQTA
jgi:hypothetical protein